MFLRTENQDSLTNPFCASQSKNNNYPEFCYECFNGIEAANGVDPNSNPTYIFRGLNSDESCIGIDPVKAPCGRVYFGADSRWKFFASKYLAYQKKEREK